MTAPTQPPHEAHARSTSPGGPVPRATSRLRALLAGGRTLFVPGCFNAMSAMVVERA